MATESLRTKLCRQLDDLLVELELAGHDLEERVLEYFRAQDLAGIESLMRERRTDSEMAADVRALLDKWTESQSSAVGGPAA